MTYNDPQHRDVDPVHRNINVNDPFIPDRSTNSHYVGMGLGIAAIVALILGAALWNPASERTASNTEPPANSTMTAPQIPSPDPSAAPSRQGSRPNG
ncbi:MAG TPA: hypothetical protein VM867_13055 [Xanthobacteraceae bacterium]|jgi:hypothetical protein|nr:hypothetical protein [Xanthobacteraceae bacterium]